MNQIKRDFQTICNQAICKLQHEGDYFELENSIFSAVMFEGIPYILSTIKFADTKIIGVWNGKKRFGCWIN